MGGCQFDIVWLSQEHPATNLLLTSAAVVRKFNGGNLPVRPFYGQNAFLLPASSSRGARHEEKEDEGEEKAAGHHLLDSVGRDDDDDDDSSRLVDKLDNYILEQTRLGVRAMRYGRSTVA